MEAAMAFEDLRKDIEFLSKVNDWERVRQAVRNKRDWAMKAGAAAREP